MLIRRGFCGVEIENISLVPKVSASDTGESIGEIVNAMVSLDQARLGERFPLHGSVCGRMSFLGNISTE
jgi:hypothetical protein